VTVSWRRLLLCLLVLALPVQGFAAALRLGCAAARAVEASTPLPCHESMQAAPVDDAAGDEEGGPAAAHPCSACAACHAQAAIAAPAVAERVAALHGVYVGARLAWPAGHLSETLERPPRSLLA